MFVSRYVCTFHQIYSFIGRGISVCFAEEGADVVVVDVQDEDTKDDSTVKQVQALGRQSVVCEVQCAVLLYCCWY